MPKKTTAPTAATLAAGLLLTNARQEPEVKAAVQLVIDLRLCHDARFAKAFILHEADATDLKSTYLKWHDLRDALQNPDQCDDEETAQMLGELEHDDLQLLRQAVGLRFLGILGDRHRDLLRKAYLSATA